MRQINEPTVGEAALSMTVCAEPNPGEPISQRNGVDLAKVTLAEVCRAAAEEAVAHLGLLKPSAVDTIINLLTDFHDHSPAKVVEAYLAVGDQVSLSELRKLGLKPHRRFSVDAMNQLSALGLKRAGPAFRLTLTRAWYSVHRYLWPIGWDERFGGPDGPETFYYQVVPSRPCEACIAISGTVVERDNLFVLPPAGCICEEGPVCLRTGSPAEKRSHAPNR